MLPLNQTQLFASGSLPKRVLFATFPADGHVNPLTGLAAYLVEKGCDVRWYTSSYYAEKIEKIGVHHYPLKRAFDFRDESAKEMMAERDQLKGQIAKLNYDMINVFIKRGPEYFDDIQEIYQSFPFEVLVSDVAFAASPMVKKILQVPVVTIGIVPLCESSKDLPPAGLGMTPASNAIQKLVHAGLRIFTKKVLFGKSNKALTKMLSAYGIEAKDENLFDVGVRTADIYLQSGTPGFEFKRSDMGANIRYIGALLPFSKKQQKTWSDPRLLQYKKVILVTQGTVETDVRKLLVPTIEAFKDTDYLVVVTTGGSETEKLRRQYQCDNVIIEDFIPFENIMPYADVYVSNGGYGGVLLAIQHELPLVVAGVHEGKNEINARVGYFDLGINLKTETPNVDQLRRSINAVLQQPAFRANVQGLAAEFSKYRPEEIFGAALIKLAGKPKEKQKSYLLEDAMSIY